ncbi:hypothetical protein [uncultured Bradyrhizobium sp.]|uniref:hypothetical protein n=1 Tax=uncultured Bradyrhizobium sp. TaxID=199684 RepID=UPI0026030E12|nr:hypothetical protein [uncultured Bradyrhizobium sp.]
MPNEFPISKRIMSVTTNLVRRMFRRTWRQVRIVFKIVWRSFLEALFVPHMVGATRRYVYPFVLARSPSEYREELGEAEQKAAKATQWKEPEPNDFSKAIFDVINKREQYYIEAVERAEYNAEAFVVLSSTGTVVAWLGLLYRIPALAASFGTTIGLPLLFVSIISVSFVKLMRIARTYAYKGKWQKGSRAFLDGRMSYEQLLSEDYRVWRYPMRMIVPAWLSITSLVAGAGFAGGSLLNWAIHGAVVAGGRTSLLPLLGD